MSADNWGVCPKCKYTAKKKVEFAYGQVSEEEYLALLNEKSAAKDERNLREDYEIGTDGDGGFSVSYLCSCSKCGFSFKYTYWQDVLAA